MYAVKFHFSVNYLTVQEFLNDTLISQQTCEPKQTRYWRAVNDISGGSASLSKDCLVSELKEKAPSFTKVKPRLAALLKR